GGQEQGIAPASGEELRLWVGLPLVRLEAQWQLPVGRQDMRLGRLRDLGRHTRRRGRGAARQSRRQEQDHSFHSPYGNSTCGIHGFLLGETGTGYFLSRAVSTNLVSGPEQDLLEC